MKFTTISTLLAAVAAVVAAPLAEEKRDVYVPKVLYPHSGTVWYSGQTHNVTWDNSDPPQNISNRALITLRAGDFGMPLILAHDFDLRAGRVEVKVPELVTNDYYSVVLFGDGGNWSENFTINGLDIPW